MLGFAAIAGLALLLASGSDRLWRALAAVLSLGLGGPPVATLVFNRGSRAVRRATWRSDGSWSIATGSREFDVQLLPASATLGGLALLVWWNPTLGRRYALVEARCIGQTTFRRLRGRLRIEAGCCVRRTADERE